LKENSFDISNEIDLAPEDGAFDRLKLPNIVGNPRLILRVGGGLH